MNLGGRVLLAFAVAASPAASAAAAPRASVWVIDDGEKIRRDATDTPFERGDQNPVWSPGEPVRVFALRGESIALQVVVEAAAAPLEEVTVDVRPLTGPGGARLADDDLVSGGALDRVGRPVERFVEHFVEVRRPSGGRTPGESLGWQVGAAPAERAWVGPVPDALVPVELGARWVPYPMRVAPRTNGIVWIDVNVPADQPAGRYEGSIVVREGQEPLASIPVDLAVAPVALGDRVADAAAFYDPEELARRVGPGAEVHLWKLLHAHRVAPLHDALRPEDVARQRSALDGTLYEPARGYLGPGRGLGDGVLALGAYGGLGDPSATTLTGLARAVAAALLPGGTEVFVYASDEDCESPRARGWQALVASSREPAVLRTHVGWTCSRDPAAQAVDVPMVQAAAYSSRRAAAAARRGKDVWIYNGVAPHTGAFLLDEDAVSPRANGWIAGLYRVPRWFYWESTYWYEQHGRAPVDPFAEAETFHNASGDWADGDGVLVYPGRQQDAFAEHSLGFDGVLPSIRLKNWRRGIEDAAYLRLARALDPRRADRIARALVPAALEDAPDGSRAAWSARGQAFYEARRELLGILLARGGGDRSPVPSPGDREPLPIARDSLAGVGRAGTAAASVVGAAALVVFTTAAGAAALLAIAAAAGRRSRQRSRSAIASRRRSIP